MIFIFSQIITVNEFFNQHLTYIQIDIILRIIKKEANSNLILEEHVPGWQELVDSSQNSVPQTDERHSQYSPS